MSADEVIFLLPQVPALQSWSFGFRTLGTIKMFSIVPAGWGHSPNSRSLLKLPVSCVHV